MKKNGMDKNEFVEFDLMPAELVALIQNAQNQDGKLRIRIPKKYRVEISSPEERPLIVSDEEIILHGKLLQLSPNRFQFLRSFANSDCVSETTIGQNIYHDQCASHDKIKKVADALERILSEQVTFEYNHGFWTILF